MAHELDTKANGEAAMIYAEEGGTPWHRLGQVIPEEKRRDLAWAMDAAGINFEVEKVPHFVWRPAEEDDPQAVETHRGWRRPVMSEDAYSVVRTDREEVVGTVGEWWHPLQNEDAFAPLEPVMDDGLAVIETGGVLRGGSQIWMLVRFDTDGIVESAYDRIDDKDGFSQEEYENLVDALHNEVGGGIMPYGLFLNDHTGSAKARVKETAVRVVCANTLDWSLAQDGGVEIEVAHIAGVEDKYRDATERLFGDLVARYVRLANFREILQQAFLPDEAFTKIVLDRAYPVKHLEQKIARREGTGSTEHALEQKSKKRKRIRDLWDGEGRGIAGDHTAWEGYNAVVEYVDHDPQSYQGPDRVQSLIDGSLGKSKSRIFRDLLDYSAAETESAKAAVLN